jgi:hypothetical protein
MRNVKEISVRISDICRRRNGIYKNVKTERLRMYFDVWENKYAKRFGHYAMRNNFVTLQAGSTVTSARLKLTTHLLHLLLRLRIYTSIPPLLYMLSMRGT